MMKGKPTTVFRITRQFATKPFQVFDRDVKLIQRVKAARQPDSSQVEYLRDEVARKTIERLTFIKRDFDKVLDLGSSSGNFEDQLTSLKTKDSEMIKQRIGEIVMTDSSELILHKWDKKPYNKELKVKKLVVDEETMDHPGLQPESFDAVVSNLSLHWVNDLPDTLRKINILLKPDGLFLGSVICEDTIFELRTALQLAESERKGGMSPRVSPLVKVNDISNLLKQNKFNLITLDVEEIVIGYPDIVTILEDIQLMGENNANSSESGVLHRDVLLAAQEIYETFHGEKDGTLPLTYRILFMIGWKQSPKQPKPLERGVGEVNLKDVLK